MKASRHNGRSGKHGVYDVKHNDRDFDVEHSEHIDSERTKQNVYWDCYQGYTTMADRGKEDNFSFNQIEMAYYVDHYSDYVINQNKRHEKARHPDRCKGVEDVLKNKKTCPEESIYQLGTIDEHASVETLILVFDEFKKEFDERFGSNVHIIDWSLHMDEATPHIHERHVFDATNRYGEIEPKQETALEELGFELPNPEKRRSKTNNRKVVFDSACRTMFLDICKRHGLELDEEPSYGGRKYLEKQDYIRMKQKEEIADQQETILMQIDKVNENRLELAKQMDLLDKNEYRFVWVTEFPLLEWSEEENRFTAMHHPFTMLMGEDLPLLDTDPGKVRAKAYDIVLNGNEIGGGSVRIHQDDIQERMFEALGFTKEAAHEQFGFLLDAFKYGVPPHAGLAYGLDRLVMLMAKQDSIRDVIAFPKIKDASCLMTEAPTPASEKQLEELSLAVEAQEETVEE